MRVAVVDIGTNSTRLLIAEVQDGRVTDELERHSQVTRLGAGVDANGHLSPEAMERVFDVLERYRAAIDRHGVDSAVAVLTSAVREAANGAEFSQAVERRYDLVPHVLSGDEEARLTFLGATGEHDGSRPGSAGPASGDEPPTLVIDIGGGSTELVLGTAGQVSFHVSNRAGVVRQTERHLQSDPPAPDELERLAADVREVLEAGVPEAERSGVGGAIAVAGTATSLAAIAQRLEPYDPERVHGYLIGAVECREILERLARLPLAERRRVPGLHPDRAPTILAGVVILLETLRLFGLAEVEVSEHDILRGAALSLAPGPDELPANRDP